ncbi:hypothetical protein HY498_04945, partial [Candidatus Woesearchaeota archaeon]|nr:hypothetical protein [Candidatus Woesearchaeota archaeon]
TSTTAPSEEAGTTPSLGGGSNSGGYRKTIMKNVEHKANEIVYSFSEAGTVEPINITIKDPYMSVTNLVIELNRPSYDLDIKIKKTILPKLIPDADKVYDVFEIEHKNLPDNYINNVILIFRVTKDTKNVALFRFNEKSQSWDEIPVIKKESEELGREIDSYDYYQSSTNSLSIFAIAFKKEERPKPFSIEPAVKKLSELKLSGNNSFVLGVYIVILLIIIEMLYSIFKILKRTKSLIRILANILICLVPLLMILAFFVLEIKVFIFGVLPIVIFSLTVLLIILAILFRRR